MTTEDFIKEVEAYLNNNNVPDRDGNIVKNFKVLYGKIKVMDEIVELTSVYPISEGMKSLFGFNRICYPIAVQTSEIPIHIAVNTNKFQEAEEHGFIKTLGHPTNYQDIEDLVRNPDSPNRGYFF